MHLADRIAHFRHRAFQPNKNRAGNDVVADIEFGDFANRCDRANVSISQSVTGGDIQSILRCQRRRLRAAVVIPVPRAQRAFAVNAARAERRLGISRGAQLDLLSADFVRRFDLFRIRIDKETRENIPPVAGGSRWRARSRCLPSRRDRLQ